MGYDPAILVGQPGKRVKAWLMPTGLVMLDFDHISKAEVKSEGVNSEKSALTPYDVYDRFLKNMPKLGLTLEHDLALAHVTPSGDGLRLVVRIRQGKSVAEMQEAIGKLVGLECDKAVKDISHLSFCPMASDILYINKALLFAPIANAQPCPERTDLVINPVQAERSAGISSSDTDTAAQRDAHSEDDGKEASLRAAGEEGQDVIPALRTGLIKSDVPAAQFPSTYHGVPYKDIVNKWIELKGGTPEPGDRHATLIALAMDLRKICDNDKEWMASIMPDFGKGEAEKRDAIDWAVSQKPSMVNGTLLEALQALGVLPKETTVGSKKVGQNKEDKEISPSDSAKSSENIGETSAENLPPAMPEKLPKLVELLTSKVMPHQRAAVATMVFPALATHVNDCTFRFLDNTKSELSLMSCLFAPQSVGKSCVKPVLQEIMADIKEQDTINRQRERDWQESQKNKKANEKGKTRPDDLVIRILSTDTTPAAFLGRLLAAEHGDGIHRNLCTYSQVDEIEDMYSFCQSGTRNKVQQMIKRTWDRDDIGAERWSANSANISTVLRWNWAACSTIDGGKKFFKHCLTDGTTSRVDFCTIIAPSGKIKFRYGDYDSEFRNALKPYIENLKSYSCQRDEDDHVVPTEFTRILELGERMNDYIDMTAAVMPDDTWKNYAWRAVVMALKKIIVLYIANGCQWEDEFEPFAWWTFHYNMWCKMNLFYDAASAKFEEEKIASTKGNRSPLKLMKREFTYQEFAEVCQKMGYEKPMNIMYKYKQRGVVIEHDNLYIVDPGYADKFGIK